MERLTKKRIYNGEAYLACVELDENECDGICTACWRAGEAVDKLAAYEDTGLTPEEIKSAITKDALIKLTAQALETTPERLRELAAADKEGRVVVLPCKVGDKLYRVFAEEIFEHRVGSMKYFAIQGRWDIETYPFCPCVESSIGKTVFLSREEAEKALAEMEATK